MHIETASYACPLDAREKDIARRLSHGEIAKTIAVDLKMSMTAVHSCVHTACRLVGAKNRTELVAIVLRKGWIE